MGTISKLLEASDRVQFTVQDTYELKAGKTGYKFYGIFFVVASVVFTYLFYTAALPNMAQNPNMKLFSILVFGMLGVMFILGLVIFLTVGTARVTFDEEGITIPGFFPFMKEHLDWDNIQKAELCGVISYSNLLSRIIKTIFASCFMQVELRITRCDVMGGEPVDFPVLSRAKDTAMALRIIREKLGARFTVY